MSASFDELFSKVSEKKGSKGSSFDSLFDEVASRKKPQKSLGRQLKDLPENVIRGAGSAIVSTPRAITGLLKGGSQYLAGKGKEQAEKEGRKITPEEAKVTDYIVNALGYPEELLEKMGLPTYQEVTEWHKKNSPTSGADQFSESPLEKGAETAGSILGSAALTPGSSFGTPARSASTALTALGVGGSEAAGADQGDAVVAGLTLPMAVKFLNTIRKGKFTPTGAEAKELYSFLKKAGLSEAEVAPILQSQRKVRTIGALAKGSQRAARSVETSKSALGRVYDNAKEKASKLPGATSNQETKLINRFQRVADDLKKSKISGPDKMSAITKIEDAIAQVAGEGISADELIATWQDINQAVNWNSFKTGKKALGALKGPMSELLHEMSPTLGKQFEMTNKSWGRLQNVAKKVKPNQFEALFKSAEGLAAAKGIYDFATTGDSNLLKGIAFKRGLKALSAEMLINPRLNNLTGKVLASVASGSKQAAIKAVRDFEKEVRKLDNKDQE